MIEKFSSKDECNFTVYRLWSVCNGFGYLVRPICSAGRPDLGVQVKHFYCKPSGLVYLKAYFGPILFISKHKYTYRHSLSAKRLMCGWWIGNVFHLYSWYPVVYNCSPILDTHTHTHKRGEKRVNRLSILSNWCYTKCFRLIFFYLFVWTLFSILRLQH